ncbi:hypothetical protein GCM10011318_00170 [Phaeocystidibacter marisrubri]|nr:hypothetical protein GCM10011318_00170 [Phaeocystidibacter marisrubri]
MSNFYEYLILQQEIEIAKSNSNSTDKTIVKMLSQVLDHLKTKSPTNENLHTIEFHVRSSSQSPYSEENLKHALGHIIPPADIINIEPQIGFNTFVISLRTPNHYYDNLILNELNSIGFEAQYWI